MQERRDPSQFPVLQDPPRPVFPSVNAFVLNTTHTTKLNHGDPTHRNVQSNLRPLSVQLLKTEDLTSHLSSSDPQQNLPKSTRYVSTLRTIFRKSH